MRYLIVKLGATGDVVRTTPLLHKLRGEIYWVTSDQNALFVDTNPLITSCVPWSKKESIQHIDFDLAINLEDDVDTAIFLKKLKISDLFGAYLNNSEHVTYTDSSKSWFDLSMISRYGKQKADELKFHNRTTYQDHLFSGLGYKFTGEQYFLPAPSPSDLSGDIAIAPKSGAVWPMKNWAYYDELKQRLESKGFITNYLPMRGTMQKHLGDINNHRYIISGDSLPMHLAMGFGIRCTSVFICTSPWEIYDYGLQSKVISPLLERYFYRRDFDDEAVRSIPVDAVFDSVINNSKLATSSA